MTEDKANAHAGMPFCGVSQFCYIGSLAGIWLYSLGNSPLGAWVVCVYQSVACLEPRLDKCDDLRPFLYPLKKWCRVFSAEWCETPSLSFIYKEMQNEKDHIGVNVDECLRIC